MKDLSSSAADGSYLESLSDLFVGFLFIFIIFLMLFSLLLAEAQKRSETVTTRLTDAAALRAQMLLQIEEALKRRGIRITIDTRTGIARLPESLLFDSGSADLKPNGHRALQIVAQELRAILPCYSRGLPNAPACPAAAHPILDAMFVEGHTDNDRFAGGYIDNYDLSASRAKETFLTLRAQAPDLDRLHNEEGQPLMSLSAYGPDRPIESNSTASGKRANRRIDLRFIVGSPSAEDISTARDSRPILQR